MADNVVALFFDGMDRINSFAGNISPLLTIFSSVVKLAKTRLAGSPEVNPDFSDICAKQNNISVRLEGILEQMVLSEINETYGKREETIKNGFTAFNKILEKIKNAEDSEQFKQYKKQLEEDCNWNEITDSVNELYRGVMGELVYGRPLLDEYFILCDGNKAEMEAKCFYLIDLFHMGLTMLITYESVTECDEDKFKTGWNEKVKKMEQKMREVLEKCN